MARKQALFRQGLAEAQPFLPDTVRMLEEICSLYKLAVVSSSYKSEVEPPLVRGAIRQYFELLITGEDVQHFKPSPEPYLLAAERLGACCPLVIEDSDAGRRVGPGGGVRGVAGERGRERRKGSAGSGWVLRLDYYSPCRVRFR